MQLGTEIRIDDAAVRRIERMVRHIPNAMRRIVPPALNRTATWTRTRHAREVARQMTIKVRDARRQMFVQKAHRNKWMARVLINNARVPLIALTPKQTGSGVHYNIPGVVSLTRRSAFLATMPSGHRGVFQRRTRKRLPIDEQYVRLYTFLDRSYMGPLAKSAGDQLAKELVSKVRYILARATR